MKTVFILILVAVLVWSCGKKASHPLSLTSTWAASGESIGYLNIERMALDLRADSTYRYYYRNAPIPPSEQGDEYTEGGRFRVRGDSLMFTVQEANGNRTTYDYARRFRLLPDTTAWPLRVSYQRRGIDFEVYFQVKR